ncbi:PTS system mannose-specific EIIBCA component [Streptomyces lavendulae subsp. lavendulae]|uniref:PTS system mannose-specific EIIBCA component n=2 Tax=Streptomyces lavendulae TaxID=1914 RepID=A0A2K8PIU2_STRLA|nr:PTS system mannose-specific EIIBCA component [Streptomyces lavendulae subsp. lavendulae]QUQ56226.1 PTS system mannose-specific EIIBCA component [Streptomyces lavendulae subsp. lavendulae]
MDRVVRAAPQDLWLKEIPVTTSPAGPPGDGGASGPERLKFVAVTACPTGIAHTYMAAEKLQQAADELGVDIKVETQGSIGAENVLSDNDVRAADGVIIAADKEVDRDRFSGKRVLSTGVADGIHKPKELIERVRSAPVQPGTVASGGGAGGERGAAYKALMNGVSHMIPFVVVGGLLLAVSIALGGHSTSKGIEFDQGTFWFYVNALGGLGFKLMLPIFSGYIAYALGDRPALVPGMLGGFLAADAVNIYGAEANAGFLGAIATGFLAGYLVVWIKKVKVPRFVQPIMPIIVIPIVSTLTLGLVYIYVIGRPISWLFTHLTAWLNGMTGSSAVVLGAIIGLMIAFDMGGPVNKTAFLVAVGLIGTNNAVMGMAAAAIPVMPLGQGLATLLRRRFYSAQERETGVAALFMGFFGISEGAIPFAAARPAIVIPANMLGGAVAGAVAGVAGVEDSVPHGGPIVALFGAVSGVAMFFVAITAGAVVTALTTNLLIGIKERHGGPAPVPVPVPAPEPVLVGAVAGADATAVPARAVPAGAPAPAPPAAAKEAKEAEEAAEAEVLSGYLTARTVKTELVSDSKEAAIREMAEMLATTGNVRDVDELVRVALAREAQGTTGLGESIAIPHAKTDAVVRPTVGFARSAEGIEWGSLDGTKARLVFMISVPEAAAGDEHLRILALLSRKLMDTGFRDRLQGAPDRAAALEVLREIR